MQKLTSSVIICTRNRLNDILSLFSSLKEQTIKPTEIIIIDSGDRPLNEHVAFSNMFTKTTFPTTQLVYKHTKPGLTYQRNVGISCASGDIIYFFDDDVVLQKNYLHEMNKTFVENSSYAGGMGTVINIGPPPSWRFKLFRKIFLLPRDYASGRFTLSGMPTHAYGTTAFKAVEVLGGCGMAYRSPVFKKNMFDEKLYGYAYMEDGDMARRVSYESPLFFNPAARLSHYNSPENRDAIVKNRAMFVHNYSYLFFKNVYPRNKLKIIAYWWSVLGLFVEAMLMRKWNFVKGYIKGLKGCKKE